MRFKNVNGVKYPKEAFAYVPEVGKPETWQFLMWESEDSGPTIECLADASLEFLKENSGSQRLRNAEKARERLLDNYRKVGVELPKIPRWIRESAVEADNKKNTHTIQGEFVQLNEAEADGILKGEAPVVVIESGFNVGKRRYYPADMLRRDYKIFEGAQMFMDHATPQEMKERPERSIEKWCGVLREVECVDMENGEVQIIGKTHIIDEGMKTKLKNLKEAGAISTMGVSHSSSGIVRKGKIDEVDTLVVESLTANHSVDFVTKPGAGGAVLMFESEGTVHIDSLTLEDLQTSRPDLVREICESHGESSTMNEQERKEFDDLKESLRDMQSKFEKSESEKKELQDKLSEAEATAGKSVAAKKLESLLAEGEGSKLPEPTKKRLRERFADVTSEEGIEEAVKDEIAHIKELAESGVVKNLGRTFSESKSTDEDEDEAAAKELLESFKNQYLEEGYSENEATRMAEVAAGK